MRRACSGDLSVHPTLPSLRAMHAAGCFGRYARHGNSGNHYKACSTRHCCHPLVECILNSFTDYSLLFLLRGRVDPGWICSILTRARSIFVMMPSTVAVQMKGFGFSFQLRRNSSIACFRSGTLTKLARLIALSLNSLNQRSTKFSQLELVGMKWHTNRGCFFSHARTRGCLWVP